MTPDSFIKMSRIPWSSYGHQLTSSESSDQSDDGDFSEIIGVDSDIIHSTDSKSRLKNNNLGDILKLSITVLIFNGSSK